VSRRIEGHIEDPANGSSAAPAAGTRAAQAPEQGGRLPKSRAD